MFKHYELANLCICMAYYQKVGFWWKRNIEQVQVLLWILIFGEDLIDGGMRVLFFVQFPNLAEIKLLMVVLLTLINLIGRAQGTRSVLCTMDTWSIYGKGSE